MTQKHGRFLLQSGSCRSPSRRTAARISARTLPYQVLRLFRLPLSVGQKHYMNKQLVFLGSREVAQDLYVSLSSSGENPGQSWWRLLPFLPFPFWVADTVVLLLSCHTYVVLGEFESVCFPFLFSSYHRLDLLYFLSSFVILTMWFH